MKGVVRYDVDGKPICEICGNAFHRLLSHVRQKHNLTEKEYKYKFGLDLGKGICSKVSSEKSRKSVFNNYSKCITNNLIDKGKTTRFKSGSTGRTKDKVSEQTRLMLRKRLTTSVMIEAMKDSGKRLGLSGLGNKARWKNNS